MALFNRLAQILGLCLICAAVWAQAPAPAATESDATKNESLSTYKLAPGDLITITVFGEEDLTKPKMRLTDAGTISYPVLGEIQVLGKTVGELAKDIADGLRGRYLVNPRVTVTIDEYRPFFINGQIGKPGSYPYQPGLTVSKAVTIAGGFTERASQDKIFLVHENDRSGKRSKVGLYDLIHPGDTITVEESFF